MMTEAIPSLSMQDVIDGTIEEKILVIQRDQLLADIKRNNFTLALTHLKSLRIRIGRCVSEPSFMAKLRQADLIEHLAELFKDCHRATSDLLPFYLELAWCFSHLTTAESYEVGFVLNSSFTEYMLDEFNKQTDNCTSLGILRHVRCCSSRY
jgi:hypothetical protein